MSYLVDANILIDAFRVNSLKHGSTLAWLKGVLSAGETVYASAMVEVAMLRIMTNPRLGPDAAPAADVFQFLSDLHALPNYSRLELQTGQYGRLEQLCQDMNLMGNDMNDAYLAALALENDLTLATADRGFSRFTGLKVLNPDSKLTP
ncbi:TA system VapC family ribonuclease toxin [Deinococcus wulumuqiensis]|uniref:Ribonuclease VapC n=1 Tax=Deinococcus wulumuqiensis TaxID=980427 RepID=A0AAV4K134_9DEIO|nr:TA system VapC family ribonuclease toxin [Deinococcus wulumuqiensis]QII19784.1 type II toxin-antitoxin system VapC family toxin [Deinococcus wulumuqiensis R12]GGI71732.1 ribonuclease VapC43 [Deinococcus wulumuqiensis]GGP28383.1 ribonuclease VapC43 [Deinococcus wulumuqiensis]